eukprot:6431604-Prymnesium_polylepis.1
MQAFSTWIGRVCCAHCRLRAARRRGRAHTSVSDVLHANQGQSLSYPDRAVLFAKITLHSFSALRR